MTDYILVCDKCRASLFVANQNVQAGIDKQICFFGKELEQFLVDHLGHPLRFVDEDNEPVDYERKGKYTKNNHRLVNV